MSNRIFVDTNLIIYSLDALSPKSATAITLLSQRPVISVQVVNETINVQLRKL